MNSEKEVVQLDEVQWRSPEWIQTYGLRTDNVLDYFALSPFYDRSSNNQILKMQTEFNENLNGKIDIQQELRNMRGTEFVVHIAQPPALWILRKQDRKGFDDVDILATYFVVGENIYQAPSVYGILSSRLLASGHTLGLALRAAQTLPTFTPMGYTYERTDNSAAEETAKKAAEAAPKDENVANDDVPYAMERALAVTLAEPHYL